MEHHSRLTVLSLLFVVFSATACGTDPVSENKPPVADITGPTQGTVGEFLTLSGTGSSDPDGAVETFDWRLRSKPSESAEVTLNGNQEANLEFKANTAGSYTIALVVGDGTSDSAPATHVIELTASQTNRAPVAEAGPDKTANVGETVELDGTGSEDPDGDSLEFSWAFESIPQDSQVSLANRSRPTTSFQPDVSGSYLATLTVTDGSKTASDSVRIDVSSSDNQIPVAEAGEDRTVSVGTEVTFDGSASSDPDGDDLNYAWSLKTKPAESASALVTPEQVEATLTPDMAGLYEITLAVSDGKAEATDTVKLTVEEEDEQNQAPEVVVGSDRRVEVGTSVQLDGSGSSDPEGGDLNFKWSLTSKPSSSSTNLQSSESPKATFTPDVEGTYDIQLSVTDTAGKESTDSVVITATEEASENQSPVADAGPDQVITAGETVTLDGSGSTDPDGQVSALTFTWSLTSKPSQSSANLLSTSGQQVDLKTDESGFYEAQLEVEDKDGATSTDKIIVTAEKPEDCLLISEMVEDGGAKAVELYNCGTQAVDLTDYYYCGEHNAQDVTAGQGCSLKEDLSGTLAAGSVKTYCRDSDAIGSSLCDEQTTAINFNGNDRFFIFRDKNGNGSYDHGSDPIEDAFGEVGNEPSSEVWADVSLVRTNQSQFGGTSTFDWKTYYRDQGSGVYSDLGQAPSFGSSSATTPSAEGDLVITEIMPDPEAVGDLQGGEWFEVHNPSSNQTYTLKNCELRSGTNETYTISSDLDVAPGEYVTFADSKDPGFQETLSYSDELTLTNSGDTVTVACSSVVIAEVAYDGGTNFPDAKGASMSLSPNALNETDNDDGSNWCEASSDYNGDKGTPNASNDSCS